MPSHRPAAELADPARVAAVRETGLLDTPPEEAFDRVTRLASLLLKAPVAAFSLLDGHRQFFKSAVGLPQPLQPGTTVPMGVSVCRHTLVEGGLAVPDARAHPIFRDHPAFRVLGLVSYLGVPLVTAAGHVVGAFCVGDGVPRDWTAEETAHLQDLARLLATEVELRVQARRLAGERRLSESQASVLERLGRSRPLDEVLAPLAEVVAERVPGAGAAILLQQGAALVAAVTVGVPAALATALRGARSAPLFADATSGRKRVVVDVGAVALGEDVAAAASDRATAWCAPVVDADGAVVAFFTVWLPARAHPTDDEARLLEGAAALVGRVLEASEALRRSEARFRGIFEQAPFSLQMVTPDGHTVLVNPAWKQLWQIPDEIVEQVILKDYNLLEDPQLRTKGITPYLARGLAGDVTPIPEIEYAATELGLRGRARWVSAVIFPLRDAAGRVTEAVLLHQDVTDRHVAEEDRERLLGELTTERARLEAIVRQLPAAVLVAEAPGGRFLLHNAQFEALMGGPGADARLPADWPLARALTDGEVVRDAEFEHVQADGRRVWLNVSASPVRDADGRIVAGVLVCTDVTERRRDAAEQRFLAQVTALLNTSIDADLLVERLARATVPDLADGCIVDLLEADRIHRFVTVHAEPAALEIMSELQRLHSPALDSPQPSARAIRTGRSELHAQVDPEFVRNGTVSERHAQLVHDLGLRSLLVVPILVRGRAIGALSLVITTPRAPFDARAQALGEELARRSAIAIENARLYREARVAVRQRDEFIGVASHELKTPLTSLKLQAQLAARRLEQAPDGPVDVPQHRRFVETTNLQLDRLTALVEDMLDVSRIVTGKLSMTIRPVDLSALVLDVLGRFADTFAFAGIPLASDVAPGIVLPCDPFRLEQVVANLLTNAIRYGGRAPVDVALQGDGVRARLRVTDRGVGIAPADQRRIFEKFERVGADVGISGLGVGLYISREIVEAHGGTIRLESTPGVGSTFTVELPLAGPATTVAG